MTDALAAWAARWPQAAAELSTVYASLIPAPGVTVEGSEARVQSEVRLEAAFKGVRLWRNNRGAGKIEDGQFTRFGLANESPALDDTLKSSDLIGWRSVVIGPADMGRTIAQFVSIETKHPGWHLTPGDKRGAAQARWLALVEADGGFGRFATGVGTL